MALPVLFGFLLTLARTGGVLAFLPLPGFTAAPRTTRLVLAVALSTVLAPSWPRVETLPSLSETALWVAVEAAFGISVGVPLSFLAEAIPLACQTLGLQAGYSYATTIDPSSQADSGVLQVLGQLCSSLLFFVFGLERQILRAFALSLGEYPPGAFRVAAGMAEAVTGLGSTMFRTGLRLALPVLALLLLVDISLALVGRVNAQLQLLSIAFPAKMLASLALLAALAPLVPALYEQAAAKTLAAVLGMAVRP